MESVHYVGNLCLRTYRYEGSDRSLRYRKGGSCVECRSKPEGKRVYYEKNRESILAKKRERYANDPKHRERNRARRAKNGEAIRERERQRTARAPRTACAGGWLRRSCAT